MEVSSSTSDWLCRVVVRVFRQTADSVPCVSPPPSLVEDGDTVTALVSPLTTDTQTPPVLSLICLNSLNTAQVCVCVCVCVLGFVKAFFCNVQMYACTIVYFLSLSDSCELI